MNHFKEPYPADLNTLIAKAEKIVTDLNEHKNLIQLSELYTETKFSDKLTRVIRNNNVFDSLGYKTNEPEDKPKEFKGIYIFIDNETPVYVGISRSVFRRLKQHGWGKTHNQCTFAYNLAKYELHGKEFKKERKEFPEETLESAREIVRSYKVALFHVENDFDLYFLEVAVAGLLKTKWNSFRTH